MDTLLLFISSPENRSMLSWLGGGLVVIAGGVWVVIKYFIERRNRTEKFNNNAEPPIKTIDMSQNINNSVTNNANGVAIGANTKIRNSQIKIGFGVRAIIFTAVIIGTLLLISSFILDRLFKSTILTEKIPEFSLVLSCGSIRDGKNPYHLTHQEAKYFSEFIQTMQPYFGKPIFLTVEISKESNPAECYRSERSPMEDDQFVDVMTFDKSPPEERWALAKEYKLYHEISANGPDLGVEYLAYLPRYEDLPSNGMYTREPYSTFFKYSGPFVPQAPAQTGYILVLFEPLSVITDSVQKQIECQRDFKNLSKFSLFLKGCRI